MVGASLSRVTLRAVVCFYVAAALAACSGNGTTSNVLPSNAKAPAKPVSAIQLCPLTNPMAFRCYAWLRTDLTSPDVISNGVPAHVGFTPDAIRSAYKLDSSKGVGQTIAIVDALGYKKAESDLANYRQAAGAPACSIKSGCLKIVNQEGWLRPLPRQPTPDAIGWLFEESLDLDVVSAVCPHCKIVLVQAKSQHLNDLYASVRTAAKFAPIVSMSWGAQEQGYPAPATFDQPNHVLVASAGDLGGGYGNGGGPQVPCVYASVVCVGGTQLVRGTFGWGEYVWNSNIDSCPLACGATNSGCSQLVAKPAWQTDKGCRSRSAADVSAVASVFSPFAVYNSRFIGPDHGPWAGLGGTSVAAPLIAAVIALAGNATTFGPGASHIWQHHVSLRDVTLGNNIYEPVTGPCASPVVYICYAKVGYDGPTGWGTPQGTDAF